MDQLERLQTALVNAHNAGDTEAATAFAAEIRKRQEAPPDSIPTPAELARSQLARQAMPDVFGMNPADAAMGIKDALSGVAQLATRGAEALSPAGSAAEGYARKAREFVEGASANVENRYKQAMQPDYASGSGVARGVGQMLATAPAMALKPAAAILGRIGQGAAVGGGMALASPVDAPGDDYWNQKGVQVTAGAALGGASVPVIEGVIKGGAEVVNKVVRMLQARPQKAIALDQNAVRQAVTDALQSSGVNPGAVPADVLATLQKQATAALSAGNRLDQPAVARAADFGALNMQPTRGQVTRDPTQYAFERNIAGAKGVGEPMAQRLTDQNRQLIDSLSDLRPAATSPDKYGAGEAAISTLAALDKRNQADISMAYEVAKKTVGADAEVPLQPLAHKVGTVVDEFGEEHIPGVVMRKLNDLGLMGGTQRQSFTIEGAEKLRKAINANYDPANKVQAAALRSLLSGVDDSVGLLSDQGGAIGPEAAAAFARARDAARNRFKLIERVPALKSVVEGDAMPDNFFDRYVLRANVTELEGLKQVLQVRPEIIQELRAQTIEHLKAAALGGKDEGIAGFSAPAYRRALSAIGDRRLDVLFSPKEVAQLKTINRVSQYVMDQPVGAPVNNSKTSSALLDMANRMRLLQNVPMLGWAPKMLENAAQTRQVQQSLQAPIARAIAAPNVPTIAPDLAGLLGRRSGLVGGGLLGFGAGGTAQ